MEDKLEPNMYVRLNCNYALGIGKTIGEIDEDNFIKTKFKDGFECSFPTYIITKASHNIVDLLEVGDYVNGEKITRVIPQDICGDEVLDYQHIFVNDKEIFKHEINSIVTKELFENIKYEVE